MKMKNCEKQYPNTETEAEKADVNDIAEYIYPKDPISYIRYADDPDLAARAISEVLLYNTKAEGTTGAFWEMGCINCFKLALLYVACAKGYISEDGTHKRNMKEVYKLVGDPSFGAIIEIAMANRDYPEDEDLLIGPYTLWQNDAQKESVRELLYNRLSERMHAN